MGWRTVIIENRSLLTEGCGYLEIHKPNQKDMLARSRVYIDEIETLIIDSPQVTVTTALLQALEEAGTSVLFTNAKHLPCMQLASINGNYSNKPLLAQTGWSKDIKNSVWQKIVSQKLRMQAGLLKALDIPQWDTLIEYAAETLPGDSTQREALGAKLYFGALFGSGFSRGKDDGINSALNYGYSIILSAFARCLAAAGYLLPLGINHKSQFNNFNLACDLMEPFRPLADMQVYTLSPVELTSGVKRRLADILNLAVPFENRECRMGDAVELYCRSVCAALNAGRPGKIPDIDFFRDGLPKAARYAEEDEDPSVNDNE